MKELEEVTGGMYTAWGDDTRICWHHDKVKTGGHRIEVNDWFFFSTYEVQYEYHCPECGNTFWEED